MTVPDVDLYLNRPYGLSWSADWHDWGTQRVCHLTVCLSEIPEVKGFGTSAAEALADLRKDFERYLLHAFEEGVEIPLPQE